MDNTLTYFSPAKLNLFLHIIGRRDDGYHLLQSYFQLLDFGDHLSFTFIDNAPNIDFICNNEQLLGEKNLVVKAAKLLQAHCQCQFGAQIVLDKIIPLGAGLGGGSSNAATALIALNQLWNLRLSSRELQALALQLGADVPFFVGGQSAFVEGVGEQLSCIQYPRKCYLILIPECQVETKQIFTASELTRNSKPITIRAFQEQVDQVMTADFRNDCQAVACEKFPQIEECLNWLNQHTSARMTGTGACVFAEFDKLEEASKIAALVPSHISYVLANGLSSVGTSC